MAWIGCNASVVLWGESGCLRFLGASPFPDEQLNELKWDEDRNGDHQERYDTQADHKPRVFVTNPAMLAERLISAIGAKAVSLHPQKTGLSQPGHQ
jgi:hypothetical protein